MNAIPLLLTQIKALRLPEPVTEHRFHPVRKWRLDVAFVPEKIAVEVDGGGFVSGRHSRGLGIERDAEKYAAAILLGWKVFRTTPRQVKNGQTVNWIEQALSSSQPRKA